jgi:hypothetical protein
MKTSIRGCLVRTATGNVEAVHPTPDGRLLTPQLVGDLVRTQMLFPVEFVKERFISPRCFRVRHSSVREMLV